MYGAHDKTLTLWAISAFLMLALAITAIFRLFIVFGFGDVASGVISAVIAVCFLTLSYFAYKWTVKGPQRQREADLKEEINNLNHQIEDLEKERASWPR